MPLSSLGLTSLLLHPLGAGKQRSHPAWRSAPLGQSTTPLGIIQPLLAPPPLSPFLQATLLNRVPETSLGWVEQFSGDIADQQQEKKDISDVAIRRKDTSDSSLNSNLIDSPIGNSIDSPVSNSIDSSTDSLVNGAVDSDTERVQLTEDLSSLTIDFLPEQSLEPESPRSDASRKPQSPVSSQPSEAESTELPALETSQALQEKLPGEIPVVQSLEISVKPSHPETTSQPDLNPPQANQPVQRSPALQPDLPLPIQDKSSQQPESRQSLEPDPTQETQQLETILPSSESLSDRSEKSVDLQQDSRLPPPDRPSIQRSPAPPPDPLPQPSDNLQRSQVPEDEPLVQQPEALQQPELQRDSESPQDSQTDNLQRDLHLPTPDTTPDNLPIQSELVQPIAESLVEGIQPVQRSPALQRDPEFSTEVKPTQPLESLQHVVEPQVQNHQPTQQPEISQHRVEPQQIESQTANVSESTPNLPDAIAPPPSDLSEIVSPSISLKTKTASPTEIETIQAKVEPDAIAPTSAANQIHSAISLETSLSESIVQQKSLTQEQKLDLTTIVSPLLSVSQSIEPSVQPSALSGIGESNVTISNEPEVTEADDQLNNSAIADPPQFELPASQVSWLHEQPRIKQPLGIREPLASPSLPPLQRQAEVGDEAIADTATQDQSFPIQLTASESPDQEPGKEPNFTPDNWSSLAELLETSTPSIPTTTPTIQAFDLLSELSENTHSTHQIEDDRHHSPSSEDNASIVSRATDSEAKAIAPSTQQNNFNENNSASWSNLSQLLEQITANDSDESRVQKELPVDSIQSSPAEPTSISLKAEPSITLAAPVQGVATAASGNVSPQELDHLAEQIYCAIRQQLEFECERQLGQVVGYADWFSPVVPQQQGGDRSSTQQRARASPDLLLDAQFQNLTREVYVQLRQRLELERERHGRV